MSKQTDFIISVKEGAIKGWQEYKVLPSLTIAQAILESGWGDSGLSLQGNNFFGIKADKSWKGAVITKKTKEYYKGKGWVTIDADFRSYDSKDDSVLDHAKFLAGFKRYANVIGETDYVKATEAIQKAGYATDPHYAGLLQAIIRSNNLVLIDQEAFDNHPHLEAKPIPAPEHHVSTHTVVSGDTLSELAVRFHTTVKHLQELNGIDNPSLIKLGQVLKVEGEPVAPKEEESIHTVVAGDTLSELAVKYHTSVANLKALNGLDSDLIKVGQELKVHGEVTHPIYYTIKSGDNLTFIARHYHTTVGTLASVNHIANPSLIKIGQVIRVK